MAVGRPVEYDWEALKKEKEASGLTTKEFCARKGLSYTNTSKEFAAIEREEIEDGIAQFKKAIAKSLPDMAKDLVKLAKDDDKNVQLKAIFGTADRIGLSPQAVNLQVNNSSTVNILAVPIFADPYTESLNSFLDQDKTLNATPESDS